MSGYAENPAYVSGKIQDIGKVKKQERGSAKLHSFLLYPVPC